MASPKKKHLGMNFSKQDTRCIVGVAGALVRGTRSAELLSRVPYKLPSDSCAPCMINRFQSKVGPSGMKKSLTMKWRSTVCPSSLKSEFLQAGSISLHNTDGKGPAFNGSPVSHVLIALFIHIAPNEGKAHLAVCFAHTFNSMRAYCTMKATRTLLRQATPSTRGTEYF